MNGGASAVERLIGDLRSLADALPSEAVEVQSVLRRHLAEIEASDTQDAGLDNFKLFADHHKGLRDLVVPGMPEQTWEARVLEIRNVARAAVRERKGPWWKQLLK